MSLTKTIKSGLIAFALLVGALGASDSAFAGTKCFIYIYGACSGGKAPSYTWIEDNFNGSPSNNGVCLHRAKEFYDWCGGAAAGVYYVNAAFNLDYVTTSSVQYLGSTNYHYFGMNWTPLLMD